VAAIGAALLFVAAGTVASAGANATDRTAGAPSGGQPSGDLALQPQYEAFYRQSVTWKPCEVTNVPLQCAEVRVPVDWARPQGEVISLAVARLPATGTRQGALLLDPGGPGSSGVDFVAGFQGHAQGWAPGYDLVGWDTRGSGRSNPLSCPPAADRAFAAAAVDRSPDTVQERLDYEQAAAVWARACQHSSGPLFAHVDSDSTARDMDVVRAVLGESKLNYAGYSYGTVLGTRYARLFPDRVGRMVLDSAGAPALDYASFMRGNTTAKEDALNGYLATCHDRAGCPFADQTVAQARDWLLGQIKHLDQAPLQAADGKGDGATLTQSMLFDAVYGPLMQPRSWPGLDQVLAALRKGDPQPAIQAAGEKATDPPLSIANAAALCLDLPDHRDARTVMADAQRSERSSPVFARPTMAGGNTVCAQWPVAAVGRTRPPDAASAPPVLVVGITHDTAGPYAWAVALADTWRGARLLTYQGYGHGAIGVSMCVRSIEGTYLSGGTLPAAGTVCRD